MLWESLLLKQLLQLPTRDSANGMPEEVDGVLFVPLSQYAMVFSPEPRVPMSCRVLLTIVHTPPL